MGAVSKIPPWRTDGRCVGMIGRNRQTRRVTDARSKSEPAPQSLPAVAGGTALTEWEE